MNGPEHVIDVVTRVIGGAPQSLSVSARSLRGGLEGAAVTELVARFVDPRGRPGVRRFVTKELRGPLVREAAVYERLVSRHAPGLAPQLHAVVPRGDAVVLHLASATRRSAWPWADVALPARVLEAIAPLHGSREALRDIPPLDHDRELEVRAAEAVEAVARARARPALGLVGRSAGALTRLARDLPQWRRALLSGPLAPCAIHGDLHSGNVVVGNGTPPRIVLLDWGRARAGSPFEDVSSWLQSLAFWEPAVRQRHDTLLGAYLAARGLPRTLSAAVRDAYWLAGASNALAGALAYHLDVASCADATPRQRARSLDAARDWLRIVRRADAVWCRLRAQGPRDAGAAPAR